jgi:hypothetical protein
MAERDADNDTQANPEREVAFECGHQVSGNDSE